MGADILLVTGARALAQHGAGERWAKERIVEAFAKHAPAKLVTGDAVGPDAWARSTAVAQRVPFFSYTAAGTITGIDGRLFGRWTTERAPDGDSIRAEWAAWYLHRDRVMVQHVAKRARQGAAVVVLALRAPWSKTNGTGYTVDRARAARLEVEDHAFMAEVAHG